MLVFSQMEERAPVLERAVASVSVTTGRVNALTNQLHDQSVVLDRLSKELELSLSEKQAVQDKSNRLEEVFAQVRLLLMLPL